MATAFSLATEPNPLWGLLEEQNQGKFYQQVYTSFFQITEPLVQTVKTSIFEIPFYNSLTDLVDRAEKIISILHKVNPHPRVGSDRTQLTRKQRGWELHQISFIKERLGKAIEDKKNYYNSHTIGRLTRFILKKLNMWNTGNTPAIQKAEEFMLKYDFLSPLVSNPRNQKDYLHRTDFTPSMNSMRVKNHVQCEKNLAICFYDYTSKRVNDIKKSIIGICGQVY